MSLILLKNFSHANFTYKKDVPFARGKINYKHPDFSLVGLYVEDENGEYIETVNVPTGDYEVNTSKTYCTKPNGDEKVNDSNVVISYVNNSLTFGGVTVKNTKCYVYLDKEKLPINVSEMLLLYTKNTSRSGSVTAPFMGNTPTTVYSKEDDEGTSYVFAGRNPNNWVKLGNLYFRIIRFNGDGSIRLIYSGEGSPVTSGTGTQIGTNKFNSSDGNNAYVGLQYTIGSVHGTGTNSTILGASNSTDAATLYGWYNSKIKPKYASLIDTNAGFCIDRDPSTDASKTNGSGGTGTTATYYRAYITYRTGHSFQTSYTPVLKCKNASDNLKIPVGLLSADEYALAGGGSGFGSSSKYVNKTFWLHTGQTYWLITPSNLSTDGYVRGYYAYLDGYLGNGQRVNSEYGVRPVINLKSTTTFEIGDYDGTAEKPWIVSV